MVIEVGVLVLALGLAAAISFWVMGGSATQSVNWGITGMVETRCVNGFQFVIGQSGSARQVLDEKGSGVRCTSGNGSGTPQLAAKPAPIPTE